MFTPPDPLEKAALVSLNSSYSPYFVSFGPCGTLAHSQGFSESILLAGRSKSGLHLRWTTVSYSSVAVALLCLAVVAGFICYLLFPTTFQSGTDAVRNLVSRGLEKVGGTPMEPAVAAGAQQAKFTAIEGTVKVKKANSNSWVSANFELALERGDVVQTSAEGMAKIVFADLTNYTVKPDSLIVIEENSTNSAQQTQVTVQLTTGTVDLATGTYVQGSRSEVVVSGATAALAPQTAAMVRNDPRADEHEVLVKSGSAQVRRGKETLPLGAYERASFRNDAATMTKTREVSPPTLITPGNMAPIFVAPGRKGPGIEFTWTPVDLAHAYRVRVSRNPFFTSTVLDKRVDTTSLKQTMLDEGAYYWLVQSVDINDRMSTESDHNRFTIIPKLPENVSVMLELQPLMQHGRLIEVKGRTEPRAKVIVNNQEVPDVKPDGTFSFFTKELPPGENMITVTAQNARGGVSTKQQKVVIQ